MALADMPSGADTILSAGANGIWYFDWFDQEYGPVKHHIGVEAYMPRPDGLPDSVEWVDADLAGPNGVASVASGSVDLVFSGQNIEHLWPDRCWRFSWSRTAYCEMTLACRRQSKSKPHQGISVEHGRTYCRTHT